MCIAQTAKRRRKQAANGYGHMSPLKRPRYSRVSAEKSKRREAIKVQKQKDMSTRKGSSNKK